MLNESTTEVLWGQQVKKNWLIRGWKRNFDLLVSKAHCYVDVKMEDRSDRPGQNHKHSGHDRPGQSRSHHNHDHDAPRSGQSHHNHSHEHPGQSRSSHGHDRPGQSQSHHSHGHDHEENEGESDTVKLCFYFKKSAPPTNFNDSLRPACRQNWVNLCVKAVSGKPPVYLSVTVNSTDESGNLLKNSRGSGSESFMDATVILYTKEDFKEKVVKAHFILYSEDLIDEKGHLKEEIYRICPTNDFRLQICVTPLYLMDNNNFMYPVSDCGESQSKASASTVTMKFKKSSDSVNKETAHDHDEEKGDSTEPEGWGGELELVEDLKKLSAAPPEENFADLKLKMKDNDEVLDAHRFILAARSSFLKELISSEAKKEDFDGTIKLEEVNSVPMKEILHWMYTGELEQSAGKCMEEVLEVATKFELNGLLESLDKKLITLANEETMFDLYKVAQKHGLQTAQGDLKKFIQKNLGLETETTGASSSLPSSSAPSSSSVSSSLSQKSRRGHNQNNQNQEHEHGHNHNNHTHDDKKQESKQGKEHVNFQK